MPIQKYTSSYKVRTVLEGLKSPDGSYQSKFFRMPSLSLVLYFHPKLAILVTFSNFCGVPRRNKIKPFHGVNHPVLKCHIQFFL